MSLKQHIIIALAAIILLTGGAIASAQTTTDPNATPVMATATPGVPNTGAGGDASLNWAILAITGIVVIAGVIYLARQPGSSNTH